MGNHRLFFYKSSWWPANLINRIFCFLFGLPRGGGLKVWASICFNYSKGFSMWSGLDAFFEKYCERMLSFDRLAAQQLKEIGPNSINNPSTPSPRFVSKKLVSPLWCLCLKKIEEHEDETEHLQQLEKDLHEDLETSYVAQLCLTWEALHCQYTQLSQKILCMPDDPTCYNHSAQLFQHFQVLLQRYIENEPFDHGFRQEIYCRTRISLPKLLQVPNVLGSAKRETM